jgi:hypothetical protein
MFSLPLLLLLNNLALLCHMRGAGDAVTGSILQLASSR